MDVPLSRNSKHIVKVAITIANESVLYELNQQESLENIINSLCKEKKLPGNPRQYSLQLTEQNSGTEIENRYITEENRLNIQNGYILKIVLSAEEMVKMIISKLGFDSDPSDERRDWCFEKLASLSSDPVFTKAFLKAGGMNVLNNLILDTLVDDFNLSNCLCALACILKFHSSADIDNKVIEKLGKIIVENRYDKLVTENALLVMQRIVKTDVFKNKREMIEKILNIDYLVQHIQNNSYEKIQENALGLINALAENSWDGRITEIMSLDYMRSIIHTCISRPGRNVSNSMAKELFVYQKLILNLLQKQQATLVDIDGTDATSIQEINNIAYRKCSKKLKTFEAKGTKNDINPTEETNKKKRKSHLNKLLQIPNNMSRLTLKCMLFFAGTYPESFVQVMLTERKAGNSFYETCNRVLFLLCKIIGIGGQPTMERKYQPLVFSVPADRPFVSELFCRALLRLTKTRREMRAKTSGDHEKVLLVLERQLAEGLNTQPHEWRELDRQLQEWDYERVAHAWQDEREKQMQWRLSSLPPVVALREARTPELLEYVAEHRLGILCEGAYFPKPGFRQQKGKQKIWFVYLSPNHKVIHYGECTEKDLPEYLYKIPVSDIKDIVTGMKCPHMKAAKNNHKIEPSLAFSILYEEDDQPHSLDLTANSAEVFDHWTDGLNTLIGRKMISKTMKSDLETLLDMDIRLQLMELEGIEIPESPPEIPDDPPDYNFGGTINLNSTSEISVC